MSYPKHCSCLLPLLAVLLVFPHFEHVTSAGREEYEAVEDTDNVSDSQTNIAKIMAVVSSEIGSNCQT